MKRYLCLSLLLVSSLSFALTPVTIDSASINYTTHTLSVVGSGFCTGALPAVTFNTTRLKVTSACSSSVVVASLPVQAAGSYRLIIANSGGASATFYVTYGAVGPQGATGPIGPMGATGLTGATGLQGVKGATGLTGATGSQGVAGPQGLTGAPGATGATGATGSQGAIGLTGATGAAGPQGQAGTNGTNGINGINGAQGIQGIPGTNGTNGTNGTGFNFRGVFNTISTYATNDVVTFTPTSAGANNITYNVNLTFGSAGSMVGTITTDGTIGVLNTSNIVSWSLTLADSSTNSTLLTPSNSAFSSGNYNTGGQPNNDFTATSTTLTMTYSNGGFWGVSGASGQFCMTDWSNCFGPVAYGTWSINGDNAYSESAAGAGSSQIIGTGGTTSTSATSTYVATGPVAAGTAIPGTSPWVMMAQAGAAGPAGAAGAIGPQGLIGLTGAPGPVGPAGPQGNPGPMGLQGPQGIAGSQGVAGTNGTNGTGFNFRGVFNTSTAYAINDVVTSAPITYNVNVSFGASGSMVGTITTDGTQGVLSVGNIVGWSLTLTDHGTNSTTLTPGNSAFGSGNYNTGGQPNSDFSATPTNLTFTYSNGGFWSVAGTSGQFCMTDWSNCFGPVAFGTWSINGDNQYSFSGAGGGSSQVIGTGGTAGGTSTYVATGPVAATTAIPGTLPWVMMAQAGTPGTPGINGTNGTNGINGMNGLPGAQGPQGLQGAASTVPGEQGPQGNPGTNGTNGLNGTPGPSLAEMRAALLQWYPQTYPAGTNPAAIAFDGSNLWITNYTSNVVTKLRANDGVIVGTYPTGTWSLGIAFDGANIWVVNSNSNTLTKLQASDGTLVGTYPVGSSPSEAVFDGANIWVTNTWSNSVTELRATDGAVIGSYSTGANPKGITFDGTNIWVSNYGSNNMTELRASDGAVLGTFPLGTGPYGVAFDGLNVWAVNGGDNTVTKLRASDGALVGTYPVGHTPYFMAFDGSNIWVTNGADNTVTKLRASNGAFLGTYAVGLRPDMVAFDGSNVWVTNDGGGVTRIGATK
jgi:hypothetical protein